jgi:eukaryotic-like serine/threonine-protein kinase
VTDSSDPTVGPSPTAGTTLQSGQRFGPFTIVRPLGSGGMGDVYEAEELDSGRRVALKVLSRSLGMETDRARFSREGRLAAGISHPHTVYVYGTDEIQGLPVIAMELAPGGTLKELVAERGPLPPAQAVASILQIVSGLEAAADAGVLHRDVKPSNCFIDSDGTIKVGDFGLSISTLTTDERSLTLLGTVLGTPAFASPEQLRGDELDVRSDIYSVGATLYYLLTGRAPFDHAHVVRLVTQVAQDMPPAPRSIRPDIPKELDAIVMRCLAKRPTERFAGYEDLRAALEPFSSSAPPPANLGIRFMAGVVDGVILWTLAIPIAAWFGDPLVPQREGMLQTSLVTWTFDILYFALLEGWWGRTPGKQLFGLRVIDEGRQRPGVPRALVRAAAWILPPGLLMFVYGYAIAPLAAVLRNTPQGALLGLGFPVLGFLVIGILFLTARRSNGYAGLQDLASGTRVVTKTTRERRARTAPKMMNHPTSGAATHIGPYVMAIDRPIDGDRVFLGYDDRLRRYVWVRRARTGEPPLPAARRTLSRSTRLRWLAGRRTEREGWDAFEAVDGNGLESMLGPAHAWSAVRRWVLDLSSEIRAGLGDGSLPPLTLDHVWITGDGRAKLIDWPGGTAPHGVPDAAGPMGDFAAAQKFLYEVGVRSLDPGASRQSRGLQVPLPIEARSFFERLRNAGFENPDRLAADADALARDRSTIGPGRRLAHLMCCALLPVMVGLFIVTMLWILTYPLAADPDLGEFAASLQRLDDLSAHPEKARHPEELQALERYVAGRHRGRVADPATWSQGASALRVSARLRTLAERAVAEHPDATTADAVAEEAIVRPSLDQARHELEELRSPVGLMALFLIIATGGFVAIAVLGLASAVIFRGGLQFRLFGIAVVTRRGHDVSRLRALARAAVAWSPAAIGLAGLVLSQERSLLDGPWIITSASSLALALVGVIYAARHPDRGLQDRIAGTTLVPR